MALPEVDGLRRNQNKHPIGRKHHGRDPIGCTISASSAADVARSNRIVTIPTTISIPTAESSEGSTAPGSASESSSGAKQKASYSTADNTKLPFRQMVRPKPIARRNRVHRRTRLQGLGNGLRLDLVRPPRLSIGPPSVRKVVAVPRSETVCFAGRDGMQTWRIQPRGRRRF